MTVLKITPYFFFNGNAEAAICLYQKALGARVEGLMRWGQQGEACPSGKQDQVMHAALHIGDALVMLSDSPESSKAGEVQRSVSVAIAVDDVGQMQEQFDALADGGSVVEKIHDAFWGEKFGVVRDAFGITWMFTCPKQSA